MGFSNRKFGGLVVVVVVFSEAAGTLIDRESALILCTKVALGTMAACGIAFALERYSDTINASEALVFTSIVGQIDSPTMVCNVKKISPGNPSHNL